MWHLYICILCCLSLELTQGTCTYGDVRLVGGSYASGQLEICVNNTWGTVCNYHKWTNVNAQIVCRQLRIPEQSTDYIGAIVNSGSTYSSANSSIPIWLDNVQCTGSESSLLQCSHSPIGINDCTRSDNVGVKCLGSYISSGTIILSRNNIDSASYYFGIVTVYYQQWGNICVGSGQTEANVICHQLGYTGASSYSRAGLVNYGTDSRPAILQDLLCFNSNYLSISQCTYLTFITSTNCMNSNSYDATVYCYTTRIWDSNPFPGMIRLRGGDFSNQGLVEVYCNGQWGTMCNSGFGSTDANTLCKQLGYDSSGCYNFLALTGNSTQPIWTTNMNSSSNEQCFNTNNSCPTTAITSCSHDRDVTLSCRILFLTFVSYSQVTVGSCAVSSTASDGLSALDIALAIIGGVIGAVICIFAIGCFCVCGIGKICSLTYKKSKAEEREREEAGKYPSPDAPPEAYYQQYHDSTELEPPPYNAVVENDQQHYLLQQ